VQVFAAILAMITEEVNSFLLASRSGRTPLSMSGHILLLNWNAQVGERWFVGRALLLTSNYDCKCRRVHTKTYAAASAGHSFLAEPYIPCCCPFCLLFLGNRACADG
jgi:hypothetical protein